MCTVTYLPLGKNDFILTSNRDESPMRKTLFPAVYDEQGVKLLYPKDELAGGTWIGVSEKKRLVCLLNGGFEKHQRKSSYRMSRGLIVKQLLTSNDMLNYVKSIDLYDIEPFTIVLIDWDVELIAYELVWDGDQKHFSKLDQAPRIWSSSPLYNQQMKLDRESWFQDWLSQNSEFSKESILEFHHNRDLGTKTTAPVMDRLFVKTVSISCIDKRDGDLEFYYKDLAKNSISEIRF